MRDVSGSRDLRQLRQRPRELSNVRVDRAQVVWLSLGGVVTLALTFALGYLVGRRAERLAVEPSPKAAIAQETRTSGEDTPDELTFYARLREKTAPDPLLRRDHSERTAPETKPEPRGDARAASREATSPDPRPEARPEPKPASEPPAPTKPEGSIDDAVARARAAAGGEADRSPKDIRQALDDGPAASGEYTVQVSAFQSMGEAQAFSAGLRRKGFKPFVVTSSIQGRGTWYRVRLGRFKDEDSAERAKRLLARSDIPAWVLRAE